MSSKTVRLTVSQAFVRFLAAQHAEGDGIEQRLIAGVFGIFGHGNVASVGQALLEAELEDPATMPYVMARNEHGVVHTACRSEATVALRGLFEVTGIPVGETQTGKGSLPYDHPLSLGAIGSTGTTAANRIADDADVVIGIGTRFSDFTTASHSAFQNPDVRFADINLTAFDAAKHSATMVVADAREGLRALAEALAGWTVPDEPRELASRLAREWDATVERAYTLGRQPLPAQSEVIGVVNEVSAPRDVVICAADSMPGDLHKLWRTRVSKGYHGDYGYSCMGYEIAGGLGARMDRLDRDVFVMIGDGSYLLAQEFVTAVQERTKIVLVLVLVQDHGFASRGGDLGARRVAVVRQTLPSAQRADLLARRRHGARGSRANAESLGVRVLGAKSIDEFRDAPWRRRTAPGPRPHRDGPARDLSAQRLVVGTFPVAEVAALESTREARATHHPTQVDPASPTSEATSPNGRQAHESHRALDRREADGR